MKNLFFLLVIAVFGFTACKKEGCTDAAALNFNPHAKKDNGNCKYETGPYLIIKVQFDSLQPRLNNFGQPAEIPEGNAAQSPKFNTMSAHYIELAPNMYTALQSGEIIFTGSETYVGGTRAADFSKAIVKGQNEEFIRIPLSQINNGTYEWLRVSLTYQNFDLKYKYNNIVSTGRLASFVGWNTYIQTHQVRSVSESIFANKLQGYWAFEDFGLIINGQSAVTTVPNPLHATSPIPAGSCIVTGQFNTPLVITGNETQDIVMVMTFSTNKSFEWQEVTQDGLFEPAIGETPVDMGIRGLHPVIE